jgi:hypothetical protein
LIVFAKDETVLYNYPHLSELFWHGANVMLKELVKNRTVKIIGSGLSA